jgi:hypothetical protein
LVKQRQKAAGGDRKSEEYQKSVVQIFAQPICESNPKARDEAATAVGTNRQYVSDAKRIAEAAPELIEQVRQGDLSLPRAKAMATLPSQVRGVGSSWEKCSLIVMIGCPALYSSTVLFFCLLNWGKLPTGKGFSSFEGV